jgi:hypothetical protein
MNPEKNKILEVKLYVIKKEKKAQEKGWLYRNIKLILCASFLFSLV